MKKKHFFCMNAYSLISKLSSFLSLAKCSLFDFIEECGKMKFHGGTHFTLAKS